MANIYIALNGDDVGTRLGNAIASDDHEELASATSAIEGAHGSIDQWVESVGGQKVTRSADEGIYVIPEEALADLESIKGAYKEQSGHGLTIGVGESMSQASKALIYGKLNGKDQVVHYEPMIEDYLSDQDVSEDEMPEDVPMDSGDNDQETAPVSDEGDQEEQGKKAAPMAPEQPAEGEESSDESSELPEGSEDSEETAPVPMAPEQEDDDESDEEDESDIPEQDDLSDDNQKASESPMPPKSLEDQPEESEDGDEIEEDAQDPDAPGSKAIDGDVDGQDFGADKDSSDQEEQDDEAAQAPEMGNEQEESIPGMGMAPKDSPVEGEESVYQDLNQDDESNPEMDMGNESYNQDDALTDMIHGDIEGDDSAPEEIPGQESDVSPNQDMGDGQPTSQLDEELRQDIASALMAFKENKDMLEQAREQNPKLYQATITMLRSMIEMAKKLGQNPEQDMQDQENEQQLNNEFPAADDQEDDMPGAPPVKPDVGGMSAEKK